MSDYDRARLSLQNIMKKGPPSYNPPPSLTKGSGKRKTSKMDTRELTIRFFVYFDSSPGVVRMEYSVEELDNPPPLEFSLTFANASTEDEIFEMITRMVVDNMGTTFNREEFVIFKKNRKVLKKHLYGGTTKFNGYGMKSLTTKDSSTVHLVVKFNKRDDITDDDDTLPDVSTGFSGHSGQSGPSGQSWTMLHNLGPSRKRQICEDIKSSTPNVAATPKNKPKKKKIDPIISGLQDLSPFYLISDEQMSDIPKIPESMGHKLKHLPTALYILFSTSEVVNGLSALLTYNVSGEDKAFTQLILKIAAVLHKKDSSCWSIIYDELSRHFDGFNTEEEEESIPADLLFIHMTELLKKEEALNDSLDCLYGHEVECVYQHGERTTVQSIKGKIFYKVVGQKNNDVLSAFTDSYLDPLTDDRKEILADSLPDLDVSEEECVTVRRNFKEVPTMLIFKLENLQCTLSDLQSIPMKRLKSSVQSSKERVHLCGAIVHRESEYAALAKIQRDDDSYTWKIWSKGYEYAVSSLEEIPSHQEWLVGTAFYSSRNLFTNCDATKFTNTTLVYSRLLEKLNAKKNSNSILSQSIEQVSDDDNDGEENGDKQMRRITKKIEKRLCTMYGQEELKARLLQIAMHFHYERRRANNNENALLECKKEMHMIVTGNPGVGKTEVARCMAGILFDIGLIEENRVYEVQREDLIGQYIGSTDKIVKEKISEAAQGVLFVDEAYRLNPSENTGKDYGRSAIEGMMRYLDKLEAPIFIFAGYRDKMEEFLDANSGLKRRISTVLHLADYTPRDLDHITRLKLHTRNISFQPDLDLENLFEILSARVRSCYNGSLANKLITEAFFKQEVRLTSEGRFDERSLLFLSNNDFWGAIQALEMKLSIHEEIKSPIDRKSPGVSDDYYERMKIIIDKFHGV